MSAHTRGGVTERQGAGLLTRGSGVQSDAGSIPAPSAPDEIVVWVCASCGHWTANSYFRADGPAPRCKTKSDCDRPDLTAVRYLREGFVRTSQVGDIEAGATAAWEQRDALTGNEGSKRRRWDFKAGFRAGVEFVGQRAYLEQETRA